MNTTWAVISWSVPSYIPSDYPIITYEIGYHFLQSRNCTVASFANESLEFFCIVSTFTNITGLNKSTCYIFGVRAYTVKGHGYWKFITNETLELPSVPTVTVTYTVTSTPIITSSASNIAFGMSALVGVLFIVLTVSIVINICLIILRMKSNSVKHTRSDDDIAMQVCEPYDLHKTKLREEESVYDECDMSPDAVYEIMPQ
ncbi:PREDICTED: uncharacterized protein LOC109583356 [Amphimedon queenslandica]|uniref:Fibronectin type-III domain-containing protein n=1 Tax=Amphimedon queenslandica TaxID=400682 RepID=A0AAN0JBZ7_AMPQE|nr:PREDICTED: uncharacterized protein LOC109583356 [Amphimedon queenslandica]|eukprot:XP_019854223.1 PREDICTED: uncharacterized protein LOC109583356 [Amphimedon queenslandica]